jgi:bifunctional UDP-N-acetylglucosamine pyrophosphorylase/glucosamine-1-phosphate N-acetyltransferase
VAPVRIGARSTVGAGSTIDSSTPDGALTLGRAKQTTIAGWRRPDKLSDEDRQAAAEARLKKPKST